MQSSVGVHNGVTIPLPYGVKKFQMPARVSLMENLGAAKLRIRAQGTLEPRTFEPMTASCGKLYSIENFQHASSTVYVRSRYGMAVAKATALFVL